MKNIALKNLGWVVSIEYENLLDSELHLSCVDYPDILSALSKAIRHAQEFFPYEIISINQVAK